MNPGFGLSFILLVVMHTLFFIAALLIGTSCSEKCADCVEEKCSDLVDICDDDPDCACMADCLGEKGVSGVEKCLGTCGLEERPYSFIPVEECVAVACPDSDECSTPGDYQAPDIPSSDDTTALEAHGGGGDLADCGFDTGLTFDPDGAILQFQSQNGNVCVRLGRKDEGKGNLANTEWSLLEMSVGTVGSVSLVDNTANLCWYSSHHNFFDWAHVWTGAVHYDLKLKEDDHGGPRTYALLPYAAGPVDSASCSPTTDGSNPIGNPITMYPFNP